MRKVLKISLAVMVSALVIAASFTAAFAKDTLVINDKAKAEKGSTVTYTLKLGDCKDKLEGIQMYVIYDKDSLEVNPDSLKFPELKGAVANPNYKKGIAFNWTSVTDLVSFDKAKVLMTVDFKVKKAGNTDITYFISEMYGDDLTYFKSFTLTNDILVNHKAEVKDETPVLCTDSSVINVHQGSFANYADGKGEENGSGKKHVMVTGETTKPVLASDGEDVTEVKKGEPADMTTIIVVLGIALAVIAIVILVILRRHFTKNLDDEEE